MGSLKQLEFGWFAPSPELLIDLCRALRLPPLQLYRAHVVWASMRPKAP